MILSYRFSLETRLTLYLSSILVETLLQEKLLKTGYLQKHSGVSDLTDQKELVDKGVIPDAIRSKSKRDVAAGGVIATFTDAIVQGFETANAVARSLSATMETLFNLPGLKLICKSVCRNEGVPRHWSKYWKRCWRNHY